MTGANAIDPDGGDVTEPNVRSAQMMSAGEASPAGARPASSAASVAMVTLMVVAALRLGRAVVLPAIIAVLLTLMLSAPMRWLQKLRIPGRVAAAIVVFGALGAGIGATSLLVSPAMQWVAAAPATIRTLETKLRRIAKPLTTLQQSADRMQKAAAPAEDGIPRTVQIASPGIFAQLSWGTVALVPVSLAVVFLTYFLLANGPLFRRKLAGLLPGGDRLKRREHLLGQIELATSHYLMTVTVINAGVGILTTLAVWMVGVPNPFLWGGIAAVLNFVPYLGPFATVTIVAIAALVSIDNPARALLAPGLFLLIHLSESNFVTPTLLGRHLPVNTVAIFVGLIFFGWLWGIPGAVLAVPLTVCVKLVCDHVPALMRVGELLDR
jgi:predicted PurR-regulated permease PerM